jgi:hypothetical protein
MTIVAAPLPPTPVALNSEARGEITAEIGRVLYALDAAAGTQVTIAMVADAGVDLDPLLILRDPSGDVIAENDDSASTDKNSVIDYFTLPVDGTYVIEATRFQEQLGSTVGGFTLAVADVTNVPRPTPEIRTAGTLRPDEPLQGRLTDDHFIDTYAYNGRAGEVITITMQAVDGSELDTYVILGTAEGDVLAEDDDGGGAATISIIEGYELPADGVYVITATRFQQEMGSTTGAYRIVVTHGTGPDVSEPGRDLVYLEVGDVVDGEIIPGQPTVLYRFDGVEGQRITAGLRFRVRSLPLILLLLDEDGRELARAADGSEGRIVTSRMIANFPLPADGEYTLQVARAPGADESGQYLLALEEADPDSEPGGTIARPLEYGETVIVGLTVESPDALFTFYADSGAEAIITVEVIRGNVDPIFVINGAFGGDVIIADEPSERITFLTGGYFSIYVRARRGIGQVAVTLE